MATKKAAKKKDERKINFNATPGSKSLGESWSYAPAPESKDHIRLEKKYDLFINGKFVAPSSGKYFDTINPATEGKLAEVAEASEKDVDSAVSSARSAYDKVWGKMPPKERA
ncbi:MAG TPA: aldehyde dehydrogenase family protein, partial [Bacteroidia bacterium]|nr:aldehyde dehydrogenase family protein [Bacteroidia bacterium]